VQFRHPQNYLFLTLNNFHGGIKYLNLNRNKFCEINYVKDGKTVNMLNKTTEEGFTYSFWFNIKAIFNYIFYFNTNVLCLVTDLITIPLLFRCSNESYCISFEVSTAQHNSVATQTGSVHF